MSVRLSYAFEKGTSVTYTYDAGGSRASKTVNGTKSEFVYLDGKLVYEKRGGDDIFYLYDSYGSLSNIRWYKSGASSPTNIYVITNRQGDVLGLYDYAGTRKVSYEYDAWGNTVSVTDTSEDCWSTLNPFRYRGYYFDTETGLYYLLSRYYDPAVGRFLNSDSLISQKSTLGFNVFAYCNNNPVNMSDPTGHLPFFLVTAAIGAVAGAIVGGIVASRSGGNVWAGIGIGAAAGALIGAGAGMAAGAALVGSITASTSAVVSGGGALVATVSAEGIGGGVAFILENLSRAASGSSTVAPAASSKMQDVVAKGKAGEALSGLVKNKEHIDSLTGTASYRIPDGLTDTVLSEVKNYSGTLSYSKQLRDFVLWSQDNKLEMHLYTNAKLSGPLQQLVNDNVIKVFPLE